MSKQSLIILVLAALIVGGLATVMLGQRTPSNQVAGESQLLIPQFAAQSEQLSLITIDDLGDEEPPVTLRRVDRDWQVAERHGYPVDHGKLRQLVQQLARLETVEAKTAKAENHASLGLAESGDEAATRLTLETDETFALLIGNTAPRRNTHYGRLVGQDQTWLLSERLDAPSVVADWLDKSIIDIPATDVREVSISHPTASQDLQLSGDGNSFVLRDIPEGRELSYPSIGNTVAGALAALSLEDVVPAATATPPDDAVVTEFRTVSGVFLQVRSWLVDEQAMVDFDASMAQPVSEETEPDPAESSGDSEQGEVGLDDAQNTAAAQVAELNQRLSPWVFQISRYKFDNLRKTRDSLLKPLPTSDDG